MHSPSLSVGSRLEIPVERKILSSPNNLFSLRDEYYERWGVARRKISHVDRHRASSRRDAGR